MLSRRSFIAASFGLLFQPEFALAAKKKKPVEVKKFGPRTLSREQWPPAISPDFVSIVDKGYALISDHTGRLAIVDLKREEGPLVIGELGALAKNTIDMAVLQGRAYALASQEPGSDAQHQLVTLSILPSNDPTILSRIPLTALSEPVSIAASAEMVAVAGVGPRGENQVLLYAISGKRRPEETTLPSATLNFEHPVTNIDLYDKQLVVVQAGRVTQLDVFNVMNIRNPERAGTIKLDGRYSHLARTRDAIVCGGQAADRKQELVMIAPRPTPHVVSTLKVPASEFLDLAVQRGQILLLANQINRQAVIPISFNPKSLSMTAGDAVLLPVAKRGAASKARIAVREKEAYIASDWGGVQVLSISKSGWQYVYSHTIPRLPAAAIAAIGNRAVLAGADLKVYDITQPDHPLLLATAEVGGTVRAVALAGHFLLALTRDTLTLRHLDKPSEVISSVKVNGQTLAYDAAQKRAFVLQAKDKTTVLTPVHVSNTLTAQKSHELAGSFNHASAANGHILVSGLNNLALYSVAEEVQLVGTRTFPNLALRALSLLGDLGVITAVDSNSRGYVLIVNTLRNELPTVGSVDVPQDAVALAVSVKTAVVIGRSPEGKDIVSFVDLSNPVGPRVLSSYPVLEAAAAVAIKDQIALVGGRGLEILSLA